MTAASRAEHAAGLTVRHFAPEESRLPHIAKVSGGRSSALMALRLAEQGFFDPERGDVALFANTSAEHPATYEFAARVSNELERYGLPVLWYEFCTVEDARSGGTYHRRASYRLVNRRPRTGGNPEGYRSDGSVFEELLSFKRRLPDPHTRLCTSELKLLPSHALLDEWLDPSTNGPARAGHIGDEPHVTAETLRADYRGTATPAAEIARMFERLLAAPHYRLAQRWQAFTAADTTLRSPISAGQGKLFAKRNPARYVTLIGLRADEKRRVDRILSRSIFAQGAGSTRCRIKTQPPGETPTFPLHDSEFTKADVLSWWQNNPPVDVLDIGTELGNCVYCFMKGPAALARLNRTNSVPVHLRGSPADIGWWVDIERRYRRSVAARNPERAGRETAVFGFLGIGRDSYAQIRAGNTPSTAPRLDSRRRAVGAAACDCTD